MNKFTERINRIINYFDRSKFEYKNPDGSPLLSNVDQFPAQDFNINEHGFPYNSIAALMKATSIDEVNMLSQRLSELPTSDVGDTSPDVVFKFTRPRSLYDVVDVNNMLERQNYYNDIAKRQYEESLQSDNSVEPSEG